MTAKQFKIVQYIDIVSRNFKFCDTQRENQYQCTEKIKVKPCTAMQSIGPQTKLIMEKTMKCILKH